jgi:hypothetical protein
VPPGRGEPSAGVTDERDERAVGVGAEEGGDVALPEAETRGERCHDALRPRVEVVIVEPGVEVRREVRVQHVAGALDWPRADAPVEDHLLESRWEQEGKDVSAVLPRLWRLAVPASEMLLRVLLVKELEPLVRRV